MNWQYFDRWKKLCPNMLRRQKNRLPEGIQVEVNAIMGVTECAFFTHQLLNA